jgi:Tfp pilus tip-associated adhesin PilY1
LCLALLLAAALMVARAAAVFDPNAQPTGWATRPALTSNVLKSGNEVVYRAEYRAGMWTGTVRANYIDANGVVQGNSPWIGVDTANILAGTHWDTGRRIVTRTTAGANVPFRWASLDATQQTALGGGTRGPSLLNFLRGERTNEAPAGLKFRTRTSVQGDIQQSTLLYWNHIDGQKRLYVGGNDGMLHVFNATNGSEVFAYVPSMLTARLPALAVEPYVHNLYVNGGLAMADVAINGTTRTLLTGALGGGGKGLFMLDMTDPAPATEVAAAATIKWEISAASAGFANLGFTYAAPRLARLTNGTAAVVVGNGYLNSGSGRASLFVVNADTGALIREIDTGSGSTSSPNGLSSATVVDTDADGRADYAYAGDIDGNLWRFDLRSSEAAGWTVSKVHTTSPQQAITTAPAVVNHPLGGRMVIVGTGRMLTAADEGDAAVHHVYGIWDGAPAANTSWLDQTITAFTSGTDRLRRVSSNPPNWASGGHRGWRLTLTAGERVVGESPFVIDERFYFTTTNPTVAAAAEGQASGSTWLMEVSFLTGGSPPLPIFDINDDNKIDLADNLGGSVIVGKHLGAGVASQPVLVDLASFSMTLFNQQSDIDYSLPSTSTDRGVSGGHFDVDFYFTSGTSFSNLKHVHEYDDKFDVTGVNMLNASDAVFNLGSKLASNVAFKVLVANQYLNPASTLSVGGGAYVSVKDYGGLTTGNSAVAALAGLPSYTLGTTTPVNTLAWKLPLDAFKSKDWWGDGGPVRAGLMPTQTGCVNKVNSNGSTPTLGPNGERHNGALTIQIIKATTPSSALELNWQQGGAKYGWRVKQADFTSWVLAEYTMFWHHPNGKCYGAAGWVPNPPEDISASSKGTTRAAGSMDPTDGAFGAAPAGVTVTGITSTVSGNVTTIVVSYSDGKKDTTVITVNADGTESVTMTDRAGTITTGTRMSSGSLGSAPQEILQPSRRINWREVVRP